MKRGIYRLCLLLFLALGFVPGAAQGQTAGTISVSVTPDRDSTVPGVQINEGDSVTLSYTANGITSGEFSVRFRIRGGTIDASDVTGVQWPGIPNARPVNNLPYETQSTRFDMDFPDGDVIINTTDDSLPEGAETFVVETFAHTQSSPNVPFTTTVSTTITILASDAARTLTVTGPASLTETDSDLESGDYTITLTGTAFTSATTVTWTVSHGTTADADFVAASDRSGTVEFGTGDGDGSTKTFTLTVAGDDMGESDETFSVQVSVADNTADSGTLYGAAASTTIVNDDANHSFAFTNPVTSITEGSAATTYTVTRTGPDISSGSTLTVTWAYAAGTPAPAATDFSGDAAPAGGTLEFTTTETSETFTVTTKEDTLNEPDEQFTLTLSIAAGAHTTAADNEGGAEVPAALGVTIADDDPVTVAIARSSGTGAVAENSGALSFSVTLAGGARASGVSTIVPFSIGGIGITAGDYDITAPLVDHDNDPGTPDQAPAATATGGSVTIAHGSSSGTITVTLSDNDLNEAQKTITVTGAAVGAGGLRLGGTGAFGAVEYTATGGAASVDVADDDAISVTIANAGTDADGDTAGHQREEGSDATFTVTMDHASAAAATIPYTIGGDVEAADYTDAGGGSVTIAAGQTTATITINLLRDADADAAEDLTVTLTAASPGPPAVTGPTVAAGGGSIAVTGTASEASATTVIVPRSAVRTLTVTGAATHDETDAASTIQYTAALSAGNAPGNMAFSSATTVTWTVTPGTGTESADFAALTGTFEFPTVSTFTVTVTGDDVNEADESFSVQLSVADETADGGTLFGAAASTTIQDDDDITYSIAADAATVSEPTGFVRPSAVYTVRLSGASEGDVEIPISTSGTATSGQDYDTPPTSVTITAGGTTAALSLSVSRDTYVEADETLIVTVGETPTVGAAGGTVTRTATESGQSATVTINSRHQPMAVSIVRMSGESGSIAENGGAANFEVVLAGRTDVAVEIPFTISGTGITAGDYDITAPLMDHDNDPATPDQAPAATATGATLFFARDTDRQVGRMTITVTATDDSAFEGAETLTVTLNTAAATPAVGAIGILGGVVGSNSLTADVEIADDDDLSVTVAAATAASVTEGGSFSIGASIPAAHTQPIVLRAAMSATAATTDNDAEAADIGALGNITIAPGATAATFTIAATNDNLNEGDETFVLTITATSRLTADSATLNAIINGMGVQTLTVQDDAADAIAVTIARQGADPVDENGGVTFRVSLSGGVRTANVVLPFTFSGTLGNAEFTITAPSGIAEDATGGTITFDLSGTPTASDSASITVNLHGDELNEAAETLILTGAAVGASGLRSAGAIDYAQDGASATANIADDDGLTYSVAAPASVAEGVAGDSPTLRFAVSLSGASAAAVTIPYTLRGTATGGPASDNARDYTWPTGYDTATNIGSLTIAAGATGNMATIDFAVRGDDDSEADETIVVSLGTPAMVGAGGGAVSRAAAAAEYEATGTIESDDANNIFALDCPANLSEAASGAGPNCTVRYETNAAYALPTAAELTWTLTHAGGAPATGAADFAGALTGSVPTIAQGSTGSAVMFALPRAVADAVSEAAETFTVTLSARAGSTLPANTQIVGGVAMPVIAASDPLTISIGDGSAGEAAEDLQSGLPLRFAPAGVSFEGALELAFTETPGAGLTAGDYSIGSSPVSVDGAAVQNGAYVLPVTVRADNLNEGAETLALRLTGAASTSANLSLAGAAAEDAARNGVLTIAANDPTSVSVAAAAPTAAEGSAAQFTVTLSGGETTAQVMLAYSFAISAQANEGEANDGANPDATDAAGGSIVIAAGAAGGTIRIGINTDGLAEAAETLVLTLGTPSGGGGGGIAVADGGGSAQVSIPENPAALHVVSLRGPDPATVSEGGTAMFIFSLPAVAAPNARSEALTANYQITGVDASDYSGSATGSVTFPASGAGATEQRLEVAIANDNLNEGAEVLTVALTGVTGTAPGGAAASGSASVTIAASDALAVTLQRSDSGGIAEGGAASAGAASFEFVLSGAQLSADVTIPYTISGVSGADITAADLTANAAAGLADNALTGSVSVAAAGSSGATTRSATLTFTAADDALNEATETFAIAIGTPSVAAGGGEIAATQPNAANGQVAIADNDALTVAVSGPASVSEGQEAEFAVTLSGAAEGSAGTLSLAYTVAVGSSQNAAAGAEANSDAAPDIVLLDAGGNVVDAAGTGADGMASGALTIAARATTAVIRLRANFDNRDEGTTPETVTLTLTGVTPQANVAGAAAVAASPDNAHRANLVNVNAARTLAVSAPGEVAEGQTIEFEIALEGAAPTSAFEVNWTLEPDGAQLAGAAASGSGLARNHGGPHLPGDPDIAPPGGALTGTVTFAAGSMASQRVNVPVRQDPLNEGTEALRLRLTAPSADAGGRPDGFPGSAPATQVSVFAGRTEIPPSDPIRLALQRPAGQSGAQDASGNFGFAVSFGCADGTSVAANNCEPVVPTTAVSIPYTYMVGGQSFTGDLRVAAGQTADALNAAAAGTPVTPPPAAMMAIEMSTTAQTVTVDFGTPQVTPPANAPAGADTSDLPVARSITSGEQMQLEREAEAARRDGREVPQTVAAAQVQVGAFSASLNAQRIDAPEGTSAVFTVTLGVASGSLSGPLMIPWSIALSAPDFAPAGSAVATAADFAGGAVPSGTLTFPATAANGATQTIAIDIATDTDPEMGGEYFQVSLGAAAGADAANVAVDDTVAVVLIPSLRASLSVDDVVAAEGADAVFVLQLLDFTGGSETTRPVIVHYILEDITAAQAGLTARRGARAAQGADFVAPLRGSVTIPARQARAEIRIPVLPDGVLEPAETFRLRFTVTADGDPPADGGRISGGGGLIVFTTAQGTATATIRDDVDQTRRRTQRVAALVGLLDRQTAELASDAIAERFDRARGAAPQTALRVAGRNLIGGGRPGAEADAGARNEDDLGLALFGAAGLGGGAGDGGGAFGGLGAGLSGGANVWRGQDLPSLAEVLRGSRFSFGAAGWSNITNLAEGLEIWGSGGAADLSGNLAGTDSALRYKGDSMAVFVGADRPLRGDMLAGLAIGYAAGDLRFTDSAGALHGSFELSGTVDTNMLSLHPYFSWWINPQLNTWVSLGYGVGSVDLEESESAGSVKRTLPGTADSSMWMLAAGIAGRVQVAEAAQLKLSFELSRVHSAVDAARFDDGARFTEARARTLRLGGEAELSRLFALDGGFALRPFATGRLRFAHNGRAAVHGADDRAAALDVGGGVEAAQPAWGLDARFAFSGQLNSSGQEEQRFSLHLNYDPSGDQQGVTMSMQTSAAQNLSGEIAYGVAFRQLGRAGLLTPYGRLDLRPDTTRWSAGLRLAEPAAGLRLGLEGGLDPGPTPTYDLLLTGQLRF